MKTTRIMRTQRRPRAPARGQRGLEPLERRALLDSTFFDGGGGDNLWNNPDNWYYHRVPTALDDVTIGYGFDVEVSGAPAAVRSVSRRVPDHRWNAIVCTWPGPTVAISSAHSMRSTLLPQSTTE